MDVLTTKVRKHNVRKVNCGILRLLNISAVSMPNTLTSSFLSWNHCQSQGLIRAGHFPKDRVFLL